MNLENISCGQKMILKGKIIPYSGFQLFLLFLKKKVQKMFYTKVL